MKRTFAHLIQRRSVAPIENYLGELPKMLHDCAPTGVTDPTAVVLMPDIIRYDRAEEPILATVPLVAGSEFHDFCARFAGPRR